jgi:hypothetical protein
MYNIRVDQTKNRLYVTLTGFFMLEEMKKCVDETIQATKKLKTGYDVISDVSQFKPGMPEVTKEIERVQKHFLASGVRRGLRVVGHSALIGMQFSRTSKEVGYNSTNVATVEEAEKILDKPA